MSVKLVFASAVVFAAGTLLLAGNACGQFSGQVRVSDAIEVPSGTHAAGVTSARCGSNILVGFGDQEANPTNSFAGYSVSRDGGASFSDLGVVPAMPTVAGSFGPDGMGGNGTTILPGANDPSVACANGSLFYYGSTYTDQGNGIKGGGCFFTFCPAISLSTSQDGGATWGAPTVVATASGDIHDLMFVSVAVDPSNTQRLYVGYLDYNFAGPADFGFPDCPQADIYEMTVASSADGGNTWASTVVDHGCVLLANADPDHLGQLASPSVAVSPDGKVYIAYQFIPMNGLPSQPNQIRFAESLDHGATFSTPLKVSVALGNATPKLAVDRSASLHSGTIYVTWSGSLTGTDTDVLISESLDGGLSFTFPRPIDALPVSGSGRFEANPVIAVDNDGQVADCFYATPMSNPTSKSVYSYNCGTSFNNAATWTLQRIAGPAAVGYDAASSDFLLTNDGFFTAFELPANGQRHVVGAKSDNP